MTESYHFTAEKRQRLSGILFCTATGVFFAILAVTAVYDLAEARKVSVGLDLLIILFGFGILVLAVYEALSCFDYVRVSGNEIRCRKLLKVHSCRLSDFTSIESGSARGKGQYDYMALCREGRNIIEVDNRWSGYEVWCSYLNASGLPIQRRSPGGEDKGKNRTS